MVLPPRARGYGSRSFDLLGKPARSGRACVPDRKAARRLEQEGRYELRSHGLDEAATKKTAPAAGNVPRMTSPFIVTNGINGYYHAVNGNYHCRSN
jgi:hypothetical protein